MPGCFYLEIRRYYFSYNAHIIRSDQAFQLLEQLTIVAGLLDIQRYRIGLKGKVSYCRLVRNGGKKFRSIIFHIDILAQEILSRNFYIGQVNYEIYETFPLLKLFKYTICYTCFLYRCVKWQQNWRDKSPCYPCALDEL